MKLGFVFQSYPHTSSAGREGLDALLAASAFCEDIAVFFSGKGVTQLVDRQQPSSVLSRDYISAFKLLELYDIEQVYVCQESLDKYGLLPEQLIIDATAISSGTLATLLNSCRKVLTF
ncbi:sulfurtransferase complex subunit TusC [Vibrio sp. ZSDZ34]|jgi:tRNA 2-thiouridine synthesizing protein C|uniref:Protein TusC homolog n=1 Tax=Vibrio gelatinilyticus TaxID=2893468 RepID=A0A9X1WD90_9VIBR|nr:sulfurtransferase complex subunit TusC [Vibrio gelatinilyticus]MCJ2378169.1 sulfurtransferase complex subunit TusC [Vibrio gelatinilyticus]